MLNNRNASATSGYDVLQNRGDLHLVAAAVVKLEDEEGKEVDVNEKNVNKTAASLSA